MSEAKKQWPNFLVGMILAGIAIAILKTADTLGVSEPWGDAIVYTLMVFVIVTGILDPAWRRKKFWGWLAAVFVAHSIGVTVFEQGFPDFARKFHGVPLGVAFMAEAVLIAALLARKLRTPKTDSFDASLGPDLHL
jgi:hypothetical protein